MTIPYSEETKTLATEILRSAGKPYTPEQVLEIPQILNAKSRYFWGNDLNDYELLKDTFTEKAFQAYWNGYPGATNADDQIASISAMWVRATWSPCISDTIKLCSSWMTPMPGC